jgi:hypothetical protein
MKSTRFIGADVAQHRLKMSAPSKLNGIVPPPPPRSSPGGGDASVHSGEVVHCRDDQPLSATAKNATAIKTAAICKSRAS